jgi:hypothetical protein
VVLRTLVVDFTSKIAEPSATLPSSLIATDCALLHCNNNNVKVFHNHLSFFLILYFFSNLFLFFKALSHDSITIRYFTVRLNYQYQHYLKELS